MKKGSSLIIYPFIILVSLLFIIAIGGYIIDVITPFITYQKLNNIANKYIFIIDKFGYLTKEEKNNLINDLKNEGLNMDNIEIIYPNKVQNYGEEIKLVIKYTIEVNKIQSLISDILNKEETILIIEKNSFSKI